MDYRAFLKDSVRRVREYHNAQAKYKQARSDFFENLPSYDPSAPPTYEEVAKSQLSVQKAHALMEEAKEKMLNIYADPGSGSFERDAFRLWGVTLIKAREIAKESLNAFSEFRKAYHWRYLTERYEKTDSSNTISFLGLTVEVDAKIPFEKRHPGRRNAVTSKGLDGLADALAIVLAARSTVPYPYSLFLRRLKQASSNSRIKLESLGSPDTFEPVLHEPLPDSSPTPPMGPYPSKWHEWDFEKNKVASEYALSAYAANLKQQDRNQFARDLVLEGKRVGSQDIPAHPIALAIVALKTPDEVYQALNAPDRGTLHIRLAQFVVEVDNWLVDARAEFKAGLGELAEMDVEMLSPLLESAVFSIFPNADLNYLDKQLCEKPRDDDTPIHCVIQNQIEENIPLSAWDAVLWGTFAAGLVFGFGGGAIAGQVGSRSLLALGALTELIDVGAAVTTLIVKHQRKASIDRFKSIEIIGDNVTAEPDGAMIVGVMILGSLLSPIAGRLFSKTIRLKKSADITQELTNESAEEVLEHAERAFRDSMIKRSQHNSESPLVEAVQVGAKRASRSTSIAKAAARRETATRVRMALRRSFQKKKLSKEKIDAIASSFEQYADESTIKFVDLFHEHHGVDQYLREFAETAKRDDARWNMRQVVEIAAECDRPKMIQLEKRTAFSRKPTTGNPKYRLRKKPKKTNNQADQTPEDERTDNVADKTAETRRKVDIYIPRDAGYKNGAIDAIELKSRSIGGIWSELFDTKKGIPKKSLAVDLATSGRKIRWRFNAENIPGNSLAEKKAEVVFRFQEILNTTSKDGSLVFDELVTRLKKLSTDGDLVDTLNHIIEIAE